MLESLYPVFTDALDSIIKIAVPVLMAAIFKYFKKKSELVQRELFNSEHAQYLVYAREAWAIVEEHFRVHDKVEALIEEKKALFEKEILIKAPQLAQDVIKSLRQTVAGEINKYKGMTGTALISSGTITAEKINSGTIGFGESGSIREIPSEDFQAGVLEAKEEIKATEE